LRARRPVAAATALAKARAEVVETVDVEAADPNLDKDEAEIERPAYRRGRGGTAVGRAVHAVLQTVDLATGAGLEATARAQALAEGIPEREAEIRALAASALQAPIVRTAVEAGHARWREVPVAALVDGVLVEGFIDLLVDTPEGLVVVDYKTDQVPSDAELDAAVARYSVQGAAYAVALETALARPVARCVFVFARAAGAVEREVADLSAAAAGVRALLPAFAGLD
jgi:ATP-dependent helicase/nuclease subunit A